MNGKGSRRRRGDDEAYRENWDRVFGKNKKRINVEKQIALEDLEDSERAMTDEGI